MRLTIEPKEKQSFLDNLKALLERVPTSHQGELRFEMDMFLSRLGFLADRTGSPEENSQIPVGTIRQNLADLLRNDLVIFLQKMLANRTFLSNLVPDIEEITRDVQQVLEELGADLTYDRRKEPAGRSTIPQIWFDRVMEKGELNIGKIQKYLLIYRSRILAIGPDSSRDYGDLRKLVNNLLISEGYEISFDEIYNAEIKLREVIHYSLLKESSTEHRLEYLMSKELISEVSEQFIKILHQEYEQFLKHTLNAQTMLNTEMIQAKKSLDQEIRNAGVEQARNLQKRIPEGDHRIKFHVWYRPLLQIGGDYYRIIQRNEHQYGIMLADISGHGIGAAMYLNTVVNSFRDAEAFMDHPEQLMSKFNEGLYDKLGANFVTAIYVFIDLKEKKLRYTNAGHTRAFLYSMDPKDRSAQFLRQNSKVLSVFQHAEFRSSELEIHPGSRLVVYTDGITDTLHTEDTIAGERKFLEIFGHTRGLALKETVELVQSALTEIQRTTPAEDDQSMIITDLLAAPIAPRKKVVKKTTKKVVKKTPLKKKKALKKARKKVIAKKKKKR